MSTTRICPVCGTENPAHARFCKHDGTPLEQLGGASAAAVADRAATLLGGGMGGAAAATALPSARGPVGAGSESETAAASGSRAEPERSALGLVRAHRRPPPAVRALIAPAAALVLAPLVVLVVGAVTPPGSALHEAFLPETSGVPAWIPGAILFFGIWVLVDVSLRAAGLIGEAAGLADVERMQLGVTLARDGPEAAGRRLAGCEPALRGAVGRRILPHLAALAAGADPTSEHALLRYGSELEAAAAESAHRVGRRLAIAMGLLGVIGSAAAAVPSGGMPVAAPALLGLAGALLALLAVAALRAQEDAIRVAVDGVALELTRGAVTHAGPGSGAGASLRQTVSALQEEVAALREETARLRDETARLRGQVSSRPTAEA